MTQALSALLFGALTCVMADTASAAVDCSGLTLNNYTIGSLSSGHIKQNYSFSGMCSLPLANSGPAAAVFIPIPTTIEAEVVSLSLNSVLVSESVKFTYGGKTSVMTTMATCTGDPIDDKGLWPQCSSKHLTGAPPIGLVTENDIVLSHGRGGNAQKMAGKKQDDAKKLWYVTPPTMPVIISPKPGEVVDPKALKIQVKLPGPHPQWQACCDLYLSFKDSENRWNGIASNLKIDASMVEGNAIYVNLAGLLTEAQKTVLAGQNMNHADMQLSVVDNINPSAKIDNDPSKIPQHTEQRMDVEFKLPRLSWGAPAKPTTPQNPYKSKPVIASPTAGTSYTGDVFVRAQKLAKDLTDDGYKCCNFELHRKANGIWSGFPGGLGTKLDLDSAGTTFALPETGDYRIKLETNSQNNSAFSQQSDWVEFKFNKPAPTPTGKGPAGKLPIGAATPDAPKPPLVFVPVLPGKR